MLYKHTFTAGMRCSDIVLPSVRNDRVYVHCMLSSAPLDTCHFSFSLMPFQGRQLIMLSDMRGCEPLRSSVMGVTLSMVQGKKLHKVVLIIIMCFDFFLWGIYLYICPPSGSVKVKGRCSSTTARHSQSRTLDQWICFPKKPRLPDQQTPSLHWLSSTGLQLNLVDFKVWVLAAE